MNIAKLKDGKTIRLNGLQSSEFFALLKIQIPLLLVFLNPKNNKFITDKFSIGDRIALNNEPAIIVNKKKVSYKTLLKEISNLQSEGFQLMVEMSITDFKNKTPLINLIDEIKEEVIESCVKLDYEDGMFSIIYKDLPDGKHARIYYFEETNSVLGFSDQGPILVVDTTKINSIEDLIC